MEAHYLCQRSGREEDNTLENYFFLVLNATSFSGVICSDDLILLVRSQISRENNIRSYPHGLHSAAWKATPVPQVLESCRMAHLEYSGTGSTHTAFWFAHGRL